MNLDVYTSSDQSTTQRGRRFTTLPGDWLVFTIPGLFKQRRGDRTRYRSFQVLGRR